MTTLEPTSRSRDRFDSLYFQQRLTSGSWMPRLLRHLITDQAGEWQWASRTLSTCPGVPGKPGIYHISVWGLHLHKKWEHFDHEADIGIRGSGPNVTSAFVMAAIALTNIITDIDKVAAKQGVHVFCTAPSLDILFVDWINAIVYAMEVHNMLFSDFIITIDQAKKNQLELDGIIKGEVIDRRRHLPVVDVKGATFTELKVYQDHHNWIAQCVVDV